MKKAIFSLGLTLAMALGSAKANTKFCCTFVINGEPIIICPNY
jgi:hypothetical protein